MAVKASRQPFQDNNNAWGPRASKAFATHSGSECRHWASDLLAHPHSTPPRPTKRQQNGDDMQTLIRNTRTLWLALAVLAAAPGLAFAGPIGTAEYQLTPNKLSEPSPISMSLVEHADGRKTVKGFVTFRPGDPPVEYEYIVNTKTREVTVKKTDLVVDDYRFDFDKIVGIAGDLSVIDDFYTHALAGGSGMTPRISEEYGWFWSSVRVRTKDPISITLAQTWMRMDYYFAGAHYLQSAIISKDHWANTQTSLGTHWLVQNSTYSGPVRLSNTEFKGSIYGKYINWDWGLPNLSTTAIHNATLTVRTSNQNTATWDHDELGEDSVVLTGWLALNMPTNAH